MLKKLAIRMARYMREETDRMNRIEPAPETMRSVTQLERMFGDCGPAIVAFKIENGYVVRAIQMGPAFDGTVGGFTYCKDHQAIADHIVSEAVREKLMPNHPQQAVKNGLMIGQVNTSPLPYRKA